MIIQDNFGPVTSASIFSKSINYDRHKVMANGLGSSELIKMALEIWSETDKYKSLNSKGHNQEISPYSIKELVNMYLNCFYL